MGLTRSWCHRCSWGACCVRDAPLLWESVSAQSRNACPPGAWVPAGDRGRREQTPGCLVWGVTTVQTGAAGLDLDCGSGRVLRMGMGWPLEMVTVMGDGPGAVSP